MSRVVNIYAAGGTGINLSVACSDILDQNRDGYAVANAVLIDTSAANIKPEYNIPEENIFLFPDLDGSGKLRRSNYDAVSSRIKSIVHNYKPGDMNIVIHSASGGSGSVIGPLITKDLLERNQPVVVCLVGSSGSKIELENTIKTITGYELMGNALNKVIPMVYKENSQTSTRSVVDNEITTIIAVLNILFSGNNAELDKSDLYNFLNYNLVTTYAPSLTLLEVFDTVIETGQDEYVISAASLLSDDIDHIELGALVEYHAVGYIPPSIKEVMSDKLPLHVCMIGGYLPKVIRRLKEKMKEYEDSRKVAPEKTIDFKEYESTDEGLIL